jgi:hypothetical protein
MQASHNITVSRGHIWAILLANVLLWVSVMVVAPKANLGGLALVGLVSIATLILRRRD